MQDLLTDAQRAEFEALFRKYDLDGDGHLTANELRAVFADRGEELDDSQLAGMVAALDDDGNGTVELSEFLSGMAVFALGPRSIPD